MHNYIYIFQLQQKCNNLHHQNTGKVTSGEGFAACTSCPEGTLSSVDGTDCASCDPGQYANETSNACYYCPEGRYAPTATTDNCIACSEGFATGITLAATTCRYLYFL